MQRDGRLQRQLERLAIHDRQRAGQPKRHRIRLGIRRQPELGAAPREHLALGLKLNMNLEADDDVVGMIHKVTSDRSFHVPDSLSTRGLDKGVKVLYSSKAGPMP